MDIPDGDLIRLAREGGPAAFRLLVERHLPMARARAARLCPRPDDADDAAGCAPTSPRTAPTSSPSSPGGPP